MIESILERKLQAETRNKTVSRDSLVEMCRTVKKVDVFSSDRNDEFTMIDENGNSEGIFKTWAVPVIPFLESNSTSLLVDIPSASLDFWDSIGQPGRETVFSWEESLKDNPQKLWQILTKWRDLTQLYDRRLFEFFEKRPLPKDKMERVAELTSRLTLAFGFAAPFYHLEAIVGDGNNTPGNPVKDSDNGTTNGGALDIVGMMLPAALKNKVPADKLNWNGLDWTKIAEIASFDPDKEEDILSARLARLLGVETSDIVFAANVLQWIPVNVGGKKDDLDQTEAISILLQSLDQIKVFDTQSVAMDINALIRFLNWLPLIRTDKNFTDGTGWRYAAVCDTSNLLLKEIVEGGVLQPEFEKLFQEKLAPQLNEIDATSAKGRFILSLANQGKFRDEFYVSLTNSFEQFIEDAETQLNTAATNENISPLKETPAIRSLVGGKVAGLIDAIRIFGEDKVVDGIVINSESIQTFLRTDSSLWNLINELKRETDLDNKLKIAELITNSLSLVPFSDSQLEMFDISADKFAVRSSTFDEDTLINGSAAGVYESVIDVTKENLGSSITEVIQSFFSEKAITYRHLHRLIDDPLMGVLITPFIEGHGGAAFSLGEKQGWEIVVGQSPAAIVSGEDGEFDSFKFINGTFSKFDKNRWVSDAHIEEVARAIELAEKVYGGKVDIEFIVDENDNLKILQLRTLNDISLRQEVDDQELTVFEIPTLEDLPENTDITGEKLRLVLDENINLDKFQGSLFRWLVKNRNSVKEITLKRRIPRTCHFANICLHLGIRLTFDL